MSTATSRLERTIFPPCSLASRERAALADAARLAQLWDVALQASFQLGYDTGHQHGLIAGRNEEATAWQAIVTGYSAVLDAPTRAELARVRRPSNEPCSSGCGNCSQCTRAAAVAANLAHYGVPDYPGTSANRQHRKGRS
jgi:hypothetical protein